MMPATNLREGENVSHGGWVYGARFRTILVKREMGWGLVMICTALGSARYACRDSMCNSHDRSSPMANQILPLRQRMIHDVKFSNMSLSSIHQYSTGRE
jgi:hypothetical protein